eukprot:SAG31_NODE_5170_length_2701_cov_3.885473_6_plen_52_part_00
MEAAAEDLEAKMLNLIAYMADLYPLGHPAFMISSVRDIHACNDQYNNNILN